MGHTSNQVCDILAKERPQTVQEAERLCEERKRNKPVMQKFVSAMALVNLDSGVPAAVDQVRLRGFSRNHGRGYDCAHRYNCDTQDNCDSRDTQDSAQPVVGYHCQKQGHTSPVCRTPFSVTGETSTNLHCGCTQVSNNCGCFLGHSVGNYNTACSTPYSGHAENQEQSYFDAWGPSHLPDLAPQEEAEAYQ